MEKCVFSLKNEKDFDLGMLHEELRAENGWEEKAGFDGLRYDYETKEITVLWKDGEESKTHEVTKEEHEKIFSDIELITQEKPDGK